MALLNSKSIYHSAKMTVHEYGFTRLRVANQYVEIMPLTFKTNVNQPNANQIEGLAFKILSVQKHPSTGPTASSQADRSQLKREIDQLFYQFYDLTKEEIKIINKENSKEDNL